MDRSPEYIKQCQKAKKILAHTPVEGDFYYGGADGKTAYVFVGGYWVDDTWLPSQSDLQEMVDNSGRVAKPLFYLVEDIHDFYHDGNQGFDSMEKLWLAFVMKEKYGKIWAGEDWVISENAVGA